MPTENLYTPNSIRTRSGQYVNVLELDPDTIRIEDIAHALSMVPRFGGHLPVFYSVGQHCLGVLNTVMDMPQPAGTTSEELRLIRLQALLHDASEAYIGDMPSPIKQHLPDFKALCMASPSTGPIWPARSKSFSSLSNFRVAMAAAQDTG